MKLHFEPNLDFQIQAIEAVCDLFRGQEVCRSEFTVTLDPNQPHLGPTFAEYELGIGNRLALSDEKILENLNAIQLRHGLPPSGTLDSGDFSVEMETGTGKTYVYLRTIFELNKRYGFTKFVIVVPSVAIKEGVYKALQITDDHLRALYSGTPFEYFLYDSAKLGQVRNFASSSLVQIMVVTVGAINKKDVNNLYKDSEKTGGEKPVDLIRATRPVLIVDEPQSVDGGLQGRGREALKEMNSLCTLRYSATHADQHHMVYRLDAVDAYERKLVKQIEVASAMVEGAHNKPYVRLLATSNRRGVISARVELDVEVAGKVRRREMTVQDGDDLAQITKRTLYHDCRIGEIRVEKGNEFVELRVPGGEQFLRLGETWGDVDVLAVQRQMIRRTIREHFDKEKRLRPQGIKVLSLFFIDAVNRYRQYDEDGNAIKGIYARIFEEEYHRLAKIPDYRTLFQEVDIATAAGEVHNGYFSIDKKGGWTNTTENNQSNRDNAERAYNLIMKEKEKLLSMETPLKFIFSHSALREGWDNPNVFQICALRDIRTERERQTDDRAWSTLVRQPGGPTPAWFRGQHAHRDRHRELRGIRRKLTGGNRDRHGDSLWRCGVTSVCDFSGRRARRTNIDSWPRSVTASYGKYLKAEGYIDAQGRIQDSLRKELKDETFSVPDEFTGQQVAITELLRKLAGGLEIRNADERRTVRPRQAILHSAEFKALWDRIKHKTTYRVAFDNEGLLAKCVRELKNAPVIPKTRLQWRKAGIAIGQSGVKATETSGAATVVLDDIDIELPDLLTELQDRTQLTRRSIQRILCGSGRLDDFKRNPQQFIELAAQAINLRKRRALIDGIKYQRLGDEHYYAQELFEKEELTGYLKNMLPNATKSVYEQVVYESGIEAGFADQLEKNDAVRVYAKLPGWFRVPTPLGSYNPDWALLIKQDECERLYFVVETKGSLLGSDLRGAEKDRIRCGEAHFSALMVGEAPARYLTARSVDDLLAGSA